MTTEPLDPDRLPGEFAPRAQFVQDAGVCVSTVLDGEVIDRIRRYAAALDVDLETLLRQLVHKGLAHVEAEAAGEIEPPPRSGPRVRRGTP